MPSYRSSDSLGLPQHSGQATDAASSDNPFLESPLEGGEPLQSEMLPQPEASFRDWPATRSWPGAAAAAAAPDSAGGLPTHNDSKEWTPEFDAQPLAQPLAQAPEDGQQRDSAAEADLPPAQQQQQQPTRQLRPQPSGNPFQATAPSPFASSPANTSGNGLVPSIQADSNARAVAMSKGNDTPAVDPWPAQAQQAGVLSGEDVTAHAESGPQHRPEGALSSTPSLAQMLSDLHLAGEQFSPSKPGRRALLAGMNVVCTSSVELSDLLARLHIAENVNMYRQTSSVHCAMVPLLRGSQSQQWYNDTLSKGHRPQHIH